MRFTPKNTLAIAIGAILTVSPAFGIDLKRYRWQNRILLVFSASETSSSFAVFDRALERERIALVDRDLIVFRIFKTGSSRVEDKALSSEDAEQLRRRFGVTSGQFTVILIGKDGGVKLVRERDAELQEILDLIDSMPMRQQEMNNRRKMD